MTCRGTTIILNHLQRSSKKFTKNTSDCLKLLLARSLTLDYDLFLNDLSATCRVHACKNMDDHALLLLQLLLHIVTRPLPSPPSSTASRRCSTQPKTQNPQASKQASKQRKEMNRWSNSFHLQSVCLYKYEEV